MSKSRSPSRSDAEPDASDPIEEQVRTWREHLRSSRAVADSDVEELEDHLRAQMETFVETGLSADEAFLVAVKRMGAVDALTREFAREHSDRLWKQLVLSGRHPEGGQDGDAGSRAAWAGGLSCVLGLAVAAAAAIKLPALFGLPLSDASAPFYLRNASFFTLPFVTAYFVQTRSIPPSRWAPLALAFAAAALVVNGFPFVSSGSGTAPSEFADTELLAILHLPIALWLVVGLGYAGTRWRGSDRRMDFIRFTGEHFIYYVLIALGGWVLVGVTFLTFAAIGIDVEPLVIDWIVPCGAAGAVVVATWLVEAKQSVIENMAPVLTQVFTPLFALLLLAFVVTMVVTGRGIDVEREVLIGFDLLLVVVFGLLLYAVSAREPLARPGLFDWVQLVLVGTTLVVDLLALWAIGIRITDFGFTPNRTAALGENLVLLVNLGVSAVLYVRFLTGRDPFARLARWQMSYLWVFAAWAAVVVVLFPLVFGFR